MIHYDRKVQRMALKDRVRLCSGKNAWVTKQFHKYGIPSMLMCDGPHGLRKQASLTDSFGIHNAVPATCFPTAVTAGATWNRELLEKMGEALSEEALANGVNLVLGPGLCLKRNPLCGRNFEYYSEDPVIAGESAAAFVNGIQSKGVGACLKHFAANNQEFKRFSSDSVVDERTLQELYLSGFERAVKKSHPMAVMAAYNLLNGVHCTENKRLLTDLLRDRWGFNGFVVTDWGAMTDRSKAFAAGCDLNMPGGSNFGENQAVRDVENGRLSEETVNASAERILRAIYESRKAALKYHAELARHAEVDDSAGATGAAHREFDAKAHSRLAFEGALEGAVLLKNDGVLPIRDMTRMLVCGYQAKNMRYQGSGSSHINPTHLAGFFDYAKNSKYLKVTNERGEADDESLVKLKNTSGKEFEGIVVFAGLPDSFEAEGFDRASLKLPDGENAMVEAAIASGLPVTVVLVGGGVIELPWADRVSAILYMGLAGQEAAKATYFLLVGAFSPSGRLTESWPFRYRDVPSAGFYGAEKKGKNAEYREGLYVGYRYYQKAGVEVRYPFGFGLSYSKFAFENLRVSALGGGPAAAAGTAPDSGFSAPLYEVSVDVTNTGTVQASEVVQLYVAAKPGEQPTAKVASAVGGAASNGYRPVRELKNFEKVNLKPGETKTVTMLLTERDFSVYDVTSDDYAVVAGAYDIEVGRSCEDIVLKEEVQVAGASAEVLAETRDGLAEWYFAPKGHPSEAEFLTLYNKPLPSDAAPVRGTATYENTLLELENLSPLAKGMVAIMKNRLAKGFGVPEDSDDPAYRMALAAMLDSSMSTVFINSGGRLPWPLLRAIIHTANGERLQKKHMET